MLIELVLRCERSKIIVCFFVFCASCVASWLTHVNAAQLTGPVQLNPSNTSLERLTVEYSSPGFSSLFFERTAALFPEYDNTHSSVNPPILSVETERKPSFYQSYLSQWGSAVNSITAPFATLQNRLPLTNLTVPDSLNPFSVLFASGIKNVSDDNRFGVRTQKKTPPPPSFTSVEQVHHAPVSVSYFLRRLPISKASSQHWSSTTLFNENKTQQQLVSPLSTKQQKRAVNYAINQNVPDRRHIKSFYAKIKDWSHRNANKTLDVARPVSLFKTMTPNSQVFPDLDQACCRPGPVYSACLDLCFKPEKPHFFSIPQLASSSHAAVLFLSVEQFEGAEHVEVAWTSEAVGTLLSCLRDCRMEYLDVALPGCFHYDGRIMPSGKSCSDTPHDQTGFPEGIRLPGTFAYYFNRAMHRFFVTNPVQRIFCLLVFATLLAVVVYVILHFIVDRQSSSLCPDPLLDERFYIPEIAQYIRSQASQWFSAWEPRLSRPLSERSNVDDQTTLFDPLTTENRGDAVSSSVSSSSAVELSVS